MADSTPETGKVSPENLMVSGSQEMLNTNEQNHSLMENRRQVKEIPMAKAGITSKQHKAALRYGPKYKMNIHEIY